MLGSTSLRVKLSVSIETRRLASRLEPLATHPAELDYVSRVGPGIYLSRRPPRGVPRRFNTFRRVYLRLRELYKAIRVQ